METKHPQAKRPPTAAERNPLAVKPNDWNTQEKEPTRETRETEVKHARDSRGGKREAADEEI